MEKVCAHCGKGSQTGNAIAHSKKHSRRRFKPNLQKCRPRSLSVAISLSRKWQGRWYCISCLRRLKQSHPKPATRN